MLFWVHSRKGNTEAHIRRWTGEGKWTFFTWQKLRLYTSKCHLPRGWRREAKVTNGNMWKATCGRCGAKIGWATKDLELGSATIQISVGLSNVFRLCGYLQICLLEGLAFASLVPLSLTDLETALCIGPLPCTGTWFIGELRLLFPLRLTTVRLMGVCVAVLLIHC